MGSLSRQLDGFYAALLDRTDAQTADALRRTQATAARALALDARQVGEPAPDFTLSDQDGNAVTLSEQLARGPVVLTFFRGGWCPFCTIALRALNNVAASFRRSGACLIGISPQAPQGIRNLSESHALNFPLLSDHANAVARSYGLVWRLDAETQDIYRRLGHDIPRINGAPGWELPNPAGYVISRDGVIRHAIVDPRVTHRLEPAEALSAVRALPVG